MFEMIRADSAFSIFFEHKWMCTVTMEVLKDKQNKYAHIIMYLKSVMFFCIRFYLLCFQICSFL